LMAWNPRPSRPSGIQRRLRSRGNAKGFPIRVGRTECSVISIYPQVCGGLSLGSPILAKAECEIDFRLLRGTRVALPRRRLARAARAGAAALEPGKRAESGCTFGQAFRCLPSVRDRARPGGMGLSPLGLRRP
jgi:hypothetical protein